MTYCAPCLADLALVREAVTSVSGTAACVAHAVLLTHPGDTPQRRLARLSDLRAIAEGKLPTASPEDAPAIELLIQEYALAGAMDMTVPLTELAGDRTPRPPKNRRNRGGRDRDRDRERERGPRPVPSATSAEGETPAAEASGRNEQTGPDEADAPPVQPAFDVNPEPAPTPASEAAPIPTDTPPTSAEGDSPAAEPSGRDDRAEAAPGAE